MAQLNDLIVTGAARFVNKIQGIVDKATCDADGANIASTYMKKGVDYVTAGRASGSTAGNGSTAEGYDNTSSNLYSHAEGLSTVASGNYAHTEGQSTNATKICAHAEGGYTIASGEYAHAEGLATTASGFYSHAEGYYTQATGIYSHAEGGSKTSSTARYTLASGNYSHAEGYGAQATGNYAHAEGNFTTASHSKSHAEGFYTKTGAENQHVMGQYNVGKSSTVFEIGWGSSDSLRKNIFEIDTTGNIRTPYAAALEASGSKLIMIKIGRVVICNFYGFPCSSYSQASVGAVELIDLAHAEYRPMYSQCGLGLIYSNENANYVCTIDMSTDGKLFVRYKGAVNTRSAGIANTYGMWANMCWITSS